MIAYICAAIGDADWNKVSQQWTIPRFKTLSRLTQGFPTLQFMVGHYLQYKPIITDESKRRETNEEAAERLMGSLFNPK